MQDEHGEKFPRKPLDDVKVLSEPEVKFVRASSLSVCLLCNRAYAAHPMEEAVTGYDGHPFLRRLCNGELVKL